MSLKKYVFALLSCMQIYKITLCLRDEFPLLTEAEVSKSVFIFKRIVRIFIHEGPVATQTTIQYIQRVLNLGLDFIDWRMTF